MGEKPLFYIYFLLFCKCLRLPNQNGLQVIHSDREIRMYRVLIILSATRLLEKFPYFTKNIMLAAPAW